MRIGIFGGVFNPPHHGHVICAQEARIQLKLDEVRMVPVGSPPHREIDGDPTGEDRVNMVRLAVIGQPGLTVSKIEIDRDGTSYTVDTLEALNTASPDNELTLIVGVDQALLFAEWREPRRIGELARVAVAGRAGSDGAPALAAVAEVTGVDPVWIEMPRVDISSSTIRERAIAGQTVAHLVPAGVAELIEQRGLYR